jgi:hypothetical protein
MEVQVNPYFDAYYCSYYLQGIAEVFGWRSIHFSHDGFVNMNRPHSLALVLRPEGCKIFIDAQDSRVPYGDALSWSDVYAKINVDANELAGEAQKKILPLGPSFGIRWLELVPSVSLAATNFWKCLSEFKGYRSWREHFANYWRPYHYRVPLTSYVHEPSREGYVFSLSRAWDHEPQCNEYRLNFIKACRSLHYIRFEGGFTPCRNGSMKGLEAFAVDHRYPLDEYIAKLKRSLVAFNTPAVYGCLGWKLAEYLALGKAVISTPLNRALPAPLEHGRHIHYVDGSVDEIAQAVELLHSDAEYRHELERNARRYFLEYLSPAKCIERVARYEATRQERMATSTSGSAADYEMANV